MLERKPVFPNVIEINYQAGERLGCNVYLIYSGTEWALIDIGYEETVEEIVELIRQLDFPLSNCKTIIATQYSTPSAAAPCQKGHSPAQSAAPGLTRFSRSAASGSIATGAK